MMVFFYLIASVLFGGISYRLRWLSLSGSIVASGFGFCLLWLGGWAWVIPLIVFFASSSVLSKVRRLSQNGKKREKRREDIRNATQVLANGGVAWILLIVNVFVPNPLWYAGYLGAIAAATADTWATEIGRLWGGPPRHLLTGKVIEKGLSGGITWQGTLGSLAGAALIGLTSVPFLASASALGIVLGGVSGLAGSLLDSLLGATLQAKYRDPDTGALFESRRGDGFTLVQGVRWVDNDRVNILCTIGGSCIAMLFAHLFLLS